MPQECAFDFEFRHLPGDDPDALLAEFTAVHRKTVDARDACNTCRYRILIVPLSVLPALNNGPEVEVVALAQELSGNNDIGKVSFGTEGSQFERAGIPTVVVARALSSRRISPTNMSKSIRWLNASSSCAD